jgi:hypothetical protein
MTEETGASHVMVEFFYFYNFTLVLAGKKMGTDTHRLAQFHRYIPSKFNLIRPFARYYCREKRESIRSTVKDSNITLQSLFT